MAENVSNVDTTYVYIDKSALMGWKSEMSTINTLAINTIEKFRSATNSIDSYLKGNFQEGYVSSVNDLMNDAVSSHNKMSELENVLQDVVNKADNA